MPNKIVCIGGSRDGQLVEVVGYVFKVIKPMKFEINWNYYANNITDTAPALETEDYNLVNICDNECYILHGLELNIVIAKLLKLYEK